MKKSITIISDNLQITNPVIHQAVQDLNPDPVKDLVTRCTGAGARAIDINPGPLSRNPEEKMEFLVHAVQSATALPILLDTTNPRALEAGLSQSKNPVIINGFSLEPEKLARILPLAAKYDTDIIGYLLYPNGHVPPGADERMEVAVSLFSEFEKHDLNPERLIIDPVIAPLLWENGKQQDREILNLIRNLPDLLGFPVRSVAGLSNLTTGKGPANRKQQLEMAYAAMLAGSGISMILMNVLHQETVTMIRACTTLLDDRIFSWETP